MLIILYYLVNLFFTPSKMIFHWGFSIGLASSFASWSDKWKISYMLDHIILYGHQGIRSIFLYESDDRNIIVFISAALCSSQCLRRLSKLMVARWRSHPIRKRLWNEPNHRTSSMFQLVSTQNPFRSTKKYLPFWPDF